MQNDLISKRELISFIDKTVVPALLLQDNVSGAGAMAGLSKVLEMTNLFQITDVLPVIHGRWESGCFDDQTEGTYFCSECRVENFFAFDEERYFYCPNCGAKMDGGT